MNPAIRPILALGLAAALMLTALAAALGSTSATFTDRVSASTEARGPVLPAPEQVAAEATDHKVLVTWSAAQGDFATGYQVFRHAGPCSGWEPNDTALLTSLGVTSTYEDQSKLEPGGTYCYAVRGTYAAWTSDVGAIIAKHAEVTLPAAPPALTKLYLRDPDMLQGQPGRSGSDRFDHGTSRVYGSSGPLRIGGSSGWSAMVQLLERGHVGAGLTVSVEVWYVSAADACGSSPVSDTQRIASGAASRTPSTADLVFDPPLKLEVPLTGNESFREPAGPHTVCMSVVATIGSGQPDYRWWVIGYGPDTWLKGPVAP